jgi:hypothetical protein
MRAANVSACAAARAWIALDELAGIRLETCLRILQRLVTPPLRVAAFAAAERTTLPAALNGQVWGQYAAASKRLPNGGALNIELSRKLADDHTGRSVSLHRALVSLANLAGLLRDFPAHRRKLRLRALRAWSSHS